MAVAKPSVPSAASGSQRRPSYRRRLGYHRRSQATPSWSSTSMTTSGTASTNTCTSNMAARSVHRGTGSASSPFTGGPSSASDDGSLDTERAARSRSDLAPESSGMWFTSIRGGRGGGRACPLLPAIAAGERVAGDALVAPDEHVPVDAAPAEAEARCRGKRVRVVRVHGVAEGRVRIAGSHSRAGEEGGRPEGQASLGKGKSGERDEHERPEADHEGLHGAACNTEARRQLLDVSKPVLRQEPTRGLLVAMEAASLGAEANTRAATPISTQGNER